MSACLALHGLGGGPYEFGGLLDQLRSRSIVVDAPVLPGHEGPGPFMGRAGWPEWTQMAADRFESLASGGRPVTILGFSTGATLALWLAGRYPVDRMVLMAPFLGVRHLARLPVPTDRYLRGIARVLPHVPRRTPAVRDRQGRRTIRDAELFRTFSLKAAVSALELIEQVKPTVAGIDAPTLILQGRHDSVVEPAGAAWLFDHLGSPDKRIEWLERSDHLIAIDHDRETVAAMAAAWLAMAGPPPL